MESWLTLNYFFSLSNSVNIFILWNEWDILVDFKLQGKIEEKSSKNSKFLLKMVKVMKLIFFYTKF